MTVLGGGGSAGAEYAEHALRLRWREQRTSLGEQGADARTLDALEDAIPSGRRAEGRAGRVHVARGNWAPATGS